MTLPRPLALLAFSLIGAPLALADTFATKPIISLASARTVIQAAEQAAPRGHPPLVISVVDDGGQLIYLERADGAAGGMVEASIKKARSAALYGFSTKVLEQQIIQGHPGFENLPDILPMEGGVPVLIHGQLAGAVAVAGGQSADDGALAEKLATALAH